MEQVCLDSTWIYDFLRGKQNAMAALEAVKSSRSLTTTSINAYEVVYGLLRKNDASKLAAVMGLFKSVIMMDFDLIAERINYRNRDNFMLSLRIGSCRCCFVRSAK